MERRRAARRLQWGLALAAASLVVAQCSGHRRAASPRVPDVAGAASPGAAAEPAADNTPPEVKAAAPVTAHVPSANDAAEPATSSTDAFRETVHPILARRCDPCHNPGGKMYDKLPFDDPGVVRSHESGILRRIKEPSERSALEAWLRPAAR